MKTVKMLFFILACMCIFSACDKDEIVIEEDQLIDLKGSPEEVVFTDTPSGNYDEPAACTTCTKTPCIHQREERL